MTLSYVFKTNWEQVKLHFWEIYTIKAFCLFFYREVFGQVIHYFKFHTYLCYTVFIPSASDKKANTWLHHFMGGYKYTTSRDNEHKSSSYLSVHNSNSYTWIQTLGDDQNRVAEFKLETSYPSRRIIRQTDNSSKYKSVHNSNSSTWTNTLGDNRNIVFLQGGAVIHLPKKFLQVAQIFTKQSKGN